MAPRQRGAAKGAAVTSGDNKPKPSPKGERSFTSVVLVLGGIIALVGCALFFLQPPTPPPQDSSSSSSSPSSSLERKAPSTNVPAANLWVAANTVLPKIANRNVSCAGAEEVPKDIDDRGSKGACGKLYKAGRCARFVADDAVPPEDIIALRNMVNWLVDEAWGGGAGPPSVVDLHADTISYKEQFVQLSQLMDFKKAEFTPEHVEVYNRVRHSVKVMTAAHFGVPEDSLFHDLMFFSQMNASKTAKTLHDEYWHSHVDADQYGTFAFTGLLYLSTEGEDFDGGTFLFDGPSGRDADAVAVQPRAGRLVAFTSRDENPHRVVPVTRGIRITLTIGFTCNAAKAASVAPFDGQKRLPMGEAE